MSAFRFRTAADLRAAYLDGSATPESVIERAIGHAGALDRLSPPMRILIALDPSDARAQAEAATRRYRAGQSLGPLDGVPVTVKDEYDVRGYGTTSGTSFLGKTPATRDALTVARLRRAGAVIFGKANMHELGMGPTGINIHHGTARNPYDPTRDTGGSSSGSGAAVASGLCPIAMGNDGGGSVRIPGALCGVPSIKGTFDRVPTEGISLLCWSLEHAGPLGATIADVALAFAAVTDEPLQLPASLPRRRDGAGPLRIGICDAWWQVAGAEVRQVARAAVDGLLAAGAVEVKIDLPHIDLSIPVGFATFGVEGAASVEKHLLAGAPIIDSARVSFDLARGLSAVTYVQTQRARALIVRDFRRALEQVDVIVTPTTGMTAPKYPEDSFAGGEMDERAANAMVGFTFAQNLSGMPAAQVCCGYDASGMPVGLQVIGDYGEDWSVLGMAGVVESGIERKRPEVWVDLLG